MSDGNTFGDALAEHTFFEPISRRELILVVGRTRETTGVVHAGVEWTKRNKLKTGCGALAGVAPELDAIYCRACGFSGRISGYEFVDVVRNARSASS